MSTASKLTESVNNGLKIVQFIQENRKAIQNTYGRSSIEEPSTGDRIKAWEAFAADQIRGNSGSEGDNEGNADTGKGLGNNTETGDNNQSGNISTSKSAVSESSTSGSNSTWDDYDSDFTDLEQWAEHTRGIGQTDRGGSTVVERNDGNEDGARNPPGSSGSPQINESKPKNGSDSGKDTEEVKQMTVVEMTPEDLQGMLLETEELPNKRVKSINVIDEIRKSLPSETGVVKKTTEGNSALTRLMEKPLSVAGATQSVQGSHQSQEKSNAAVENARQSAHFVRTMSDDTPSSATISRVDSLSDSSKLDEILENQKKILESLQSLSQIKEEILNIKKVLTNQSVAISTLDGYISSLMVVIPGSGRVINSEEKPINPDLRLVIGRDKSRGKMEVTKRYDEKDKIIVSEDLQVIPEIDEKFITRNIDQTVNNAANFVPTDDKVSVQIIQDMIDTEVSDPNLVQDLSDLVQESYGRIPLKDVYRTIREIIDQVDIHNSSNE